MGLDFQYKYLLYFLRLISPFSPKSVAAWLNISNDSGPVFISVVLNFGDESNQRGTLVEVKVFWHPFGVMEPTQVVELVHPVEFGIVEKQQQV